MGLQRHTLNLVFIFNCHHSTSSTCPIIHYMFSSAAAQTPQWNLRTYWGQPVREFAHLCYRASRASPAIHLSQDPTHEQKASEVDDLQTKPESWLVKSLSALFQMGQSHLFFSRTSCWSQGRFFMHSNEAPQTAAKISWQTKRKTSIPILHERAIFAERAF